MTDAALERLDTRRASSRRRLASARTPRAQAAEARRLATAYQATAGMLSRRGEPGARVAPTLAEVELAYARLGAAALKRERRTYAAASRAVRRGEGRLQQEILALNRGRP